MQKLAVVALMVVAANAASMSFNNGVTGAATLGYPNRASAGKAGGDSIWGAFKIDAAMRPNIVPNDGYYACLVIMAQMTSKLADATASFCATSQNAPYSDPSGSTLSCFGLNMDVTKGTLSNMGVYDMTPRANGTGGTYAWMDAVAVGATVTKCTTCASTSDFSVTALIAKSGFSCTKANVDSMTFAPVSAVDDINTWTFDASGANAGGAGYQTQPALIMINPTLQGGLPVFTLATPDTTGSMHVAMKVAPMSTGSNAYPAPTFPTPPSSQTSSGQDTTVGPLVAPLGTAAAGSFRTGSVKLAAPASGSAWFIAPYVDTGSTWTIAVGYGHEPNAAIAAAPSLLLAAIFAVIAMML
jgi:hypothetical protein